VITKRTPAGVGAGEYFLMNRGGPTAHGESPPIEAPRGALAVVRAVLRFFSRAFFDRDHASRNSDWR
jgi:hypothetical protein